MDMVPLISASSSNNAAAGQSAEGTSACPQTLQSLLALQDKQDKAQNQLVSLRAEQLKLRAKQLAALHTVMYDAFEHARPDQAELVLQSASCIRHTLSLVHSASLRLKEVTSLEEALLVSRQITKTDHRASNCFSLCSRLMVVIESAHMSSRESQLFPAGATKEGIALLPCGPAMDWPGVSWEDPCSICLEKLRPESTVSCLQCRHVHHHSCLSSWLQMCNRCPLCNAMQHLESAL